MSDILCEAMNGGMAPARQRLAQLSRQFCPPQCAERLPAIACRRQCKASAECSSALKEPRDKIVGNKRDVARRGREPVKAAALSPFQSRQHAGERARRNSWRIAQRGCNTFRQPHPACHRKRVDMAFKGASDMVGKARFTEQNLLLGGAKARGATSCEYETGDGRLVHQVGALAPPGSRARRKDQTLGRGR